MLKRYDFDVAFEQGSGHRRHVYDTSEQNAKMQLKYIVPFTATLISESEVGPDIEDAQVGDTVTLITSLGVQIKTEVIKSTKLYLFVADSQAKFRRKDGHTVGEKSFRSRILTRYEKDTYDEYWRTKSHKDRARELRSINWDREDETLVELVYDLVQDAKKK